MRFSTQEDRDRHLAEYPDRRSTETPGWYELADGGHLSIFCLEVREYNLAGREVIRTQPRRRPRVLAGA